jgi:hypothetical protein
MMITGSTTEGAIGSAGYSGTIDSSKGDIKYNEYLAPGNNPYPPNTEAFMDHLLMRDKGGFPSYIKSFEGLSCIYNWDREVSWHEIYWNHDQYLQVQSNVIPERFIELMVELFTDAWETPPVFIASSKNKKQLFELCNIFPEFNEKIKGLKVNLIDD